MKISLIILTLNEIEGLKYIYDKIPTQDVEEVIAVDGGSTDGSIEFLRDKNCKVYVQRTPGRGAAFREAFEIASGDALIFFSPDGNEDPSDISRFREILEQGEDLVIANRMSNGGVNEEDIHFFKFRKWANNAFSLMANMLWNKGEYVYDTINGYRAITRKAWDMIKLDGQGYTIEYQSTIRAFKLKLRIKEFPTCEGQRIDNRVGSPSLRTGLAFLKLFFYELLNNKL